MCNNISSLHKNLSMIVYIRNENKTYTIAHLSYIKGEYL